MQDSDFVIRLKRGEGGAFKELVDSYGQMILNTCYSFLKNGDDARDIAQDVFVEAFQSIHTFRSDANIRTWLYRIAVNKSLNFLKRQKRHAFTDDFTKIKSSALQGEEASQNTEDEERKKVLHEAIQSLSKNQRIAFTLHKIDEKSYKEISEIMDISLSSVESLMHRAKGNLQKKLIHYYKNQ